MKFVLALLAVLFLGGCAEVNKIHPNLATQMVKSYPELQAICDYAGGCQNVDIKCTKYDGSGNTSLRNLTWWTIETSETSENSVQGDGWSEEEHLDNHAAIEQAIRNFWEDVEWRKHKHDEDHPAVYPHQTPCPKDCWK